MSEKPKKSGKFIPNLSDFAVGDNVVTERGHGAPAAQLGRSIRKIFPMGMRVVVRLKKDKDVSEGGLYLPEGAKSATAESLLAEVLEVASAVDDHTDEETNVSGVPLGALVLIPKDAGLKVPWDENLRIVETKDILATVNEISVL